MRHQLNHLMCQLRRWGQMSSAPHEASTGHPPLTEALEQATGLDARTGWPTHRIRSFLLMQCSVHKTG